MAVDKEQIRKFIDSKVEEARKWCAAHPDECADIDFHESSGSNPLLWAVVVTLLVYFALFYTKPSFVTKVDPETEVVTLDMMRAWLFAIVAGIIAYVMISQ